MDIVVVGAGLGGLRTVEELRRAGHAGGVTLVGEEREHPYDRPPLSKQALQDGTAPPLLRPVGAYAELDVDLRLGVAAVHLDRDASQVHLADGAALAYDALVLAPGAVPRRLPGPQPRGVRLLRTAADAAALRSDLLAHQSLVVVGGGFIGCEVASSARLLGGEVDLVEALPGPLVRVLGPVLAARVRDLHVEHGVRLHTGVGVRGLVGQPAVQGVELDDGRLLPAKVVLAGLGVTPATDWLHGSLELAPDGGIACDSDGLAAPGIWAVGDAAAWGTGRRIEHWTSAVEQAASVAQSVLGHPPIGTGVPYVWSEQHGSLLQCVGVVGPDTETEVLRVGVGLAALHTDGDRLLGAVLLDARRLAGRVRRVLTSGSSVQTVREALLRS